MAAPKLEPSGVLCLRLSGCYYPLKAQMENHSIETSDISQSSSKRFALASIAGVFLVFYFVQWFAANLPEFQFVQITFGLFFSVAVFLWCQIDARERGTSVGAGFALAALLVCPIAVIYYFFRTRGLRGGFVAIGWALLFMVLVILISSIELIILSLFSDRMGVFKDL